MKYKLIYVALLLLLISAFCKIKYVKIKQSSSNDYYVDTFNVKYQRKFMSTIKYTNYNIFVGFTKASWQVNNKIFKQLIFGDSVNSFIAYVSQDSSALYYINKDKIDNGKTIVFSALVNGKIEEEAFLYFDKPVHYKWRIDIPDSYFSRKEISYEGIEHENNDDIYIYALKDELLITANYITKIYYSRKNRFVRFELMTHWFPVDVYKSH